MSADGDDDDAQLKQLRAVWVSMREEAPPDSGLAALMAAAREKADEMKSDAEDAAKPGWWQRVLAALKRPPVLALASVAVLIGGALVVANRSDEVSKPQVAGRAPQAGLMEGIAKDVVKPRAAPAGEESAAHELPPAQEKLKDAVVDPVMTPEPPKDTAEPPRKPEPPKRPAKMSPPPPRVDLDVEAKPSVEAKLEQKETAKAGAKVKLDAAEGGDEAGVVGGVVSGDAVAAPTTRGPRKKDATPQAPEAQGTTIQNAGAQPDKPAQTNKAIAQLIAQCESAAARNDCGAVKTLAARIKSGDAAAYKQRVVNNASIARCLEITVSE